jgi:hypothetical protein
VVVRAARASAEQAKAGAVSLPSNLQISIFEPTPFDQAQKQHRVGYNALNASTNFLHIGGMAVLIEGLPCPGPAAAVATAGVLGGIPMKVKTGQVRVILMKQSSTSQFTVLAREDRRRGSPDSHCSHDKKALPGVVVYLPQQVEAESLGEFHLEIILVHFKPIPDGPDMNQV